MNKINNPEKFIWGVLKRHFPFLIECTIYGDRTLIEDINQTGWLACLEGNFDFKASYNACQRELYALAKQLGFRRTRDNHWKIKEIGEKK